MTDLVPADEIEQIVGVPRHPRLHYGRAVSAEKIFYILHSRECLDSTTDLRECEFSVALDNGLDMDVWKYYQDFGLPIRAVDDRLRPGY